MVKKRQKTKIGESKLPHYWQSSLVHLCPKTKKEEEWVHAYLGIVDEAPATSNASAQALSSLSSLLLKLMLQAL
jgi:hypothetical protein